MEPELTTLEFERLVEDAIASVPKPLAGFMSNVGVIVDEQAPPWQSVLGLYQGVPLTRRTTTYAGALPDKITIFRHPIERVYGSGSGGTSYVFFTNAQAADNIGVELELRSVLGQLGSHFAPLSVFANATFMQSRIELAPNTAASATNLSRRMVGQAPYVLNTGLTYASTGGATSATILFNRVGERIAAAGASPLPDVIDRPLNVLDFSLRSLLLNGTTLRFDLKNLLDSPYETIQGTVVRERYRAGRVVNLGLQLDY
jgi:hypothetical protein